MIKKVARVLLLLLVSVSAYSGGRLADVKPGIPCDAIPNIEKLLGSLELNSSESKDLSEYSGNYGGRKAMIIYHCANGILAEQLIVVSISNREEAYRFARLQKIELSRRFGIPIHDGLDLGTWRKLFFGFLGADLDYLTTVVVWGRAKEDVMLLVRQIGANLWQVSISQGSSKLEYIINS